MRKNCFSFPIEFIDDAFGDGSALADVLVKVAGSPTPRVFLVADMNVVQRTEGLGTRIGRYFNKHGIALAGNPVVVAGGEKVKTDNLQTVMRLSSAMIGARLAPTDCVLILGGGTLLDVTNYVAAQVRGGVKVVRMPTTPSAMLDGAYATYGAVNSQNVKDALRVSTAPSAVVIDTQFARTVLDGVWRGGLGELIRIAAVSDAALFKKIGEATPDLVARNPETLAVLIRTAVGTLEKKGLLSSSQWMAFRLEAMSSYKLPYGYAMAIGVYLDAHYASARGLMKESDCESICGLLKACGAVDGLDHSRHLLSQSDEVLRGLDAWYLATGTASVVVPSGIGKSVEDSTPDRDTYRQVMAKVISRGAESQNMV